MQFSESWLRSFVDPDLSIGELADRLTMSGLEVEHIAPAAPLFSGVVVAEVLEVRPHPDADRLRVCKVDAGTGASLNIVCGAPNVALGIKVPCALVGAELPAGADGKPLMIKLGRLRGVESEGMLCSARELQLSDDAGGTGSGPGPGLLILPDDAPTGADVRKVLDLDDRLVTLKLTPNRADCLSVLGIAREVAALTGAPLKIPAVEAVHASIADQLPVKISAPDLCGRFVGRIIRGVNARAATPEWMKQRLARSGQRSVSALVDISNYVMLELGQPSHVFDLAKIHGGLEVRWGRPGESLELLNGNIVDVDEGVGVIADDSRIESLAGIMGGNATAVSLDTRDIYLEAAFWLPQAIQGRARRYNFSTDAAHRFERGVDYGATAASFERVTRLIVDICGSEQTRVGPVDDQIVNVPEARSVAMRVARATKVIGVDIGAGTVAEIFKRLSFSFTREPDRFVVDPPSYRFDIAVEEDLIEEVARCHGYENVPANLPVAQHTMRAQPEGLTSLHAIREQLAMLDYQEALNYSFVDPSWESDFAGNTSPLTLLNPIASQLAVMRTTLIGSLVSNVRYNLNRKATRVRMFEIAKVYLKNRSIPDDELKVGGIDQPTRVAAIAYGPAFDEQWGTATRVVDFFDVKNDLETLFAPRLLRFDRPGSAAHAALHPGRSARVILDGESIGWIGELHPRWIQKYEIPQAPVIFEIDAASLQRRVLQQTREVSRFPGVTRDLAFVVDEAITAQRMFDVIDAVRAEAARVSGAARHVQNAVLFDQYRGKGLKDNTKSLAFRFQLQDTDRTLDDQTIEHALADVIRALTSEVGAVVRT